MRAIEIQGLVQESRDSYDAINALKLINELQRKNLAQIRGEISDSNLQDTLISFLQNSENFSIMFSY